MNTLVGLRLKALVRLLVVWKRISMSLTERVSTDSERISRSLTEGVSRKAAGVSISSVGG